MENKVFIKYDEEGKVYYTHYMPFDLEHGLHKSIEELEKEGTLVDKFIEPEVPENQMVITKYNSQNNSVYFEFIEIEHELTEIEILSNKVDILSQENANIYYELMMLS